MARECRAGISMGSNFVLDKSFPARMRNEARIWHGHNIFDTSRGRRIRDQVGIFPDNKASGDIKRRRRVLSTFNIQFERIPEREEVGAQLSIGLQLRDISFPGGVIEAIAHFSAGPESSSMSRRDGGDVWDVNKSRCICIQKAGALYPRQDYAPFLRFADLGPCVISGIFLRRGGERPWGISPS